MTDGAIVMPLVVVAILILTSPAVPAQQLFASTVARPYIDDAVDTRGAERSSRPPPNVSIPAQFRDQIETMLRSSPTFRGQCARIARTAHLHVVIQLSLLAPAQSALTRLTRQPDGRLDAEVELGPLGDVTVLIAHEFEHILEQLDGVDLTALSHRSGTGVRADPNSGNFETERAIAIGRRVGREVSIAVARR